MCDFEELRVRGALLEDTQGTNFLHYTEFKINDVTHHSNVAPPLFFASATSPPPPLAAGRPLSEQ